MRIGSILRQACAPVATGVLLFTMHLQHESSTDETGVAAFHEAARLAVEGVASQIGAWEGSDVDVPQAAVALLKPNALLGRRYVHSETGRSVSLVIVQCRDTRDMSGHYPPVCYPAHGWTDVSAGERAELAVSGGEVEAARYAFTRAEFDRATRVTIFNFFVIPEKGTVPDMEGVRRAASDYRLRQYGAAQVQIIVDAGLPARAQEQIAAEIVRAIVPVLDVLKGDAGREEPS